MDGRDRCRAAQSQAVAGCDSFNSLALGAIGLFAGKSGRRTALPTNTALLCRSGLARDPGAARAIHLRCPVWPHRGQARSYRYGAGLGYSAVPVGAAVRRPDLPANGCTAAANPATPLPQEKHTSISNQPTYPTGPPPRPRPILTSSTKARPIPDNK